MEMRKLEERMLKVLPFLSAFKPLDLDDGPGNERNRLSEKAFCRRQ